jgi:hypothetical protein
MRAFGVRWISSSTYTMKGYLKDLAGLEEQDYIYRKLSLMSAGSHVAFQVGLYEFCR